MKLVLVRHAQTIIDTNVLSTEWQLSDEGRDAAKKLAMDPVFAGADAIFSSLQPKAIETAEIIGRHIDLQPQTEEGLAELSSVTRGFIEDYATTVHRLYAGEIQRINEGETLEEARERFNTAVDTICRDNPEARTIVIVSHANALSLFSAQYSNHEAVELHNSITMPDVAVLEWQNGEGTFRRFWGKDS